MIPLPCFLGNAKKFRIYQKISMNKIVSSLVFSSLIVIMGACTSAKQVTYLQNVDEVDLAASKMLYDATIMPKDLLTITVSTLTPEAAAPFNMAAQATDKSADNAGYLVDNDGNINFPVIGKLHVGGLTKTRCEEMIREKVLPYMAITENPVVSVRQSGFRVTVLGDVNGPGVVSVTSERMSILEAIAEAGDLTMYGKRKNVLLLREDGTGHKNAYRIDLTDAELLNSPLYYLQQNDVIYVEPNGVKKRSASVGSSTSLIVSCLSVLTSTSSLIVTIVRD